MIKRFLKLTALIEAATGLALIAVPGIVVRLLLGAEISGARHTPRSRRGSRVARARCRLLAGARRHAKPRYERIGRCDAGV
jgi:hypothetical protein